MRRITGHLREENGKWYAVVNHYDTEGKRKVRWHNLDLPVTKGNKKEAQHRLQRLLDQINTGDLYLMENMTPAERENPSIIKKNRRDIARMLTILRQKNAK